MTAATRARASDANQPHGEQAFADVDSLISTKRQRGDVGEHRADEQRPYNEHDQAQRKGADEQPADLANKHERRNREREIVVPGVDQHSVPGGRWWDIGGAGNDEIVYERARQVVWRVDVEMPEWTSTSRRRLRQLRDAVADEPDVRGVLEVWPLRSQLWWRLFPNDFDPYLEVEVAADTPGRASAKAEEAVRRALGRCGASPEARSWIIETDSRLPK